MRDLVPGNFSVRMFLEDSLLPWVPHQAVVGEDPVQSKDGMWQRAYQRWSAKLLLQPLSYNWTHMSRAGLSASMEITTMCEHKYGTMVHANNYGPLVIRLSSTVAVKFGHGVTRQEAVNQHFAFQHASCTDLKVPQVFAFLMNTVPASFASVGHIVMEYINGVAVEDLVPELRDKAAQRVATAMRQLSVIPLPADVGPGPVMKDGIASGYFWGDGGSPMPFETLDSMTI